MKQIARNLTDPEDGFLVGKCHVLMDRDGKFSPAFREILNDAGAAPLQLPPRSPNLNAHIETIKAECLGRMILFGERSLKRAIAAYLEHYHAERNHQGIGNELIDPGEEVCSQSGEIECRERLGGMLRYYHRKAA